MPVLSMVELLPMEISIMLMTDAMIAIQKKVVPHSS